MIYEGRPGSNRFDRDQFRHMKCFDLIKWTDHNDVSREMRKFYDRRIPSVLALIKKNKPYGLAQAKYIALVYDKQSPFIPEHPIITDRKKAVASFLGMNESKYETVKLACIDLSNEAVVDALSDYLKWQDDYVWAMIVQNEEVFYGNQRQILQGVNIEGKDTDRFKAAEYQSKLLSINNSIQKTVKALWAEFTGNDPFAEAKLKERKPVSPETMAEYDVEGVVYELGEEEE